MLVLKVMWVLDIFCNKIVLVISLKAFLDPLYIKSQQIMYHIFDKC